MNSRIEPRRRRLNAALLALGLAAGTAASATEKYDMRYAPGNGGGDMSAPLEPGMYFQMPLFVYRGKLDADTTNVTVGAAEMFTGTLAPLAAAFPSASATTPVNTRLRVEADVLLPRWTWMSNQRWLGGTLGATAMLPLAHKRLEVTTQTGTTTVTGVDAATLSVLTGGAASVGALAAGVNANVAAGASAQASAFSGSGSGVGDLEVAPLLRWSDQGSQIILAPTLVLPTGRYDATRAVNAGSGNFYTFRPSLQASHIGDAWDVGLRAALALNTKNTDTGYRTGNYLNLDLAVMREVGDGLRAGLVGYAVVQTTRDRMDGTPDAAQALTVGRKGRVFALGPAIAWVKGAGELLLDAHVQHEFQAVDRPQGTALWVTLSVPLP